MQRSWLARLTQSWLCLGVPAPVARRRIAPNRPAGGSPRTDPQEDRPEQKSTHRFLHLCNVVTETGKQTIASIASVASIVEEEW
jgi:hypothetical protein